MTQQVANVIEAAKAELSKAQATASFDEISADYLMSAAATCETS